MIDGMVFVRNIGAFGSDEFASIKRIFHRQRELLLRSSSRLLFLLK